MGRIVSATTSNAWATLSEGVSAARVEAHRIHQHLAEAMALIQASKAKDHIYEVAGDSILAVPRHMEQLERHLDRTSYALSVLGVDILRDSLPVGDRKEVDDAMDNVASMISRVASRHLADLSPPLGVPGGPCQVIRRIKDEVRNPSLKNDLIENVSMGHKLENADAAKVYRIEEENGVGRLKHIAISPHAQYRMDQRSITMQDLKLGMAAFLKAWSDDKSRKGFMSVRWEENMARGTPIEFSDPKTKLFIAFKVMRDQAIIITTYWEGKPDPKAVNETSCRIG